MRTLYRGDGLEVGAEPVLDTLADTGDAGDPRDADVAPDGSVWIANAATDQVIRFDRDGTPEVMAGSVGGGGGCENCLRRAADARRPVTTRSAKGFPLARPMSVALAPGRRLLHRRLPGRLGHPAGRHLPRRPRTGRIHKIAGCLCNEPGRRRLGARRVDDPARPRGRPGRHALPRRLPQRPHPGDRRRRHDPHGGRRRRGRRRLRRRHLRPRSAHLFDAADASRPARTARSTSATPATTAASAGSTRTAP